MAPWETSGQVSGALLLFRGSYSALLRSTLKKTKSELLILPACSNSVASIVKVHVPILLMIEILHDPISTLLAYFQKPGIFNHAGFQFNHQQYFSKFMCAYCQYRILVHALIFSKGCKYPCNIHVSDTSATKYPYERHFEAKHFI